MLIIKQYTKAIKLEILIVHVTQYYNLDPSIPADQLD